MSLEVLSPCSSSIYLEDFNDNIPGNEVVSVSFHHLNVGNGKLETVR
jgi:hypothetical protein